jgi:phage-related protein
MSSHNKRIAWWGSSLEDLKRMPPEVRETVGYALRVAQDGGQAHHARRMKGTLRDVVEIAEHDDTGRNTFRVAYTTAIGDVVYVLDAFQKKAKSGIATPAKDLRRIEQRLKAAREYHATKQP